jgi:hypothetical protein
LEDNPEIMRPVACFNKELKLEGNGKPEANVADWNTVCSTAAQRKAGLGCDAATRGRPLYTCTYKSLSSFWQASHLVMVAHAGAKLMWHEQIIMSKVANIMSKCPLFMPTAHRSTNQSINLLITCSSMETGHQHIIYFIARHSKPLCNLMFVIQYICFEISIGY